MATKRNSKKTPPVVQTMAAQIPSSNPAEIDPEIERSLLETLDAGHKAGVARETFFATAKNTAGIWWTAWKSHGVLPGNGKMLDTTVGAVKAACKVKGIAERYSKNEFDYAFSSIANFCYLLLEPSIKLPAAKKDQPDVTVETAGTNVAKVKALAAAARARQGTAAKRDKAPAVSAPASDPVAAGIKTFEANHDSVLALIKRTLAMDSGLGLIEDALKVYGWILIPTAEKKAELEAASKAMEFKRKSAEMAEAAEKALKARAARRRK